MIQELSAQTVAKKDAPKADLTLNIVGASYSVGDLTMAYAAHLRDEKDVMSGALIWLAGGLAAARYGHPGSQKQLELTAAKFEQHLKEQGVAIPDNVRDQNELLKKPGFLQKCEQFLYKHPSEMLNLAYGIGAALLLKNGVRELTSKEKGLLPKFTHGFNTKGVLEAVNGISKNFWMGALIGGGALAGLLIKEDPKAKEKAANGNIFERSWAAIKAKPLLLTGTLYGLNNIFTILKTVEDHSNFRHSGKALKPYYFSGTTAACYLLSNALLTTVSRDRTAKQTFSDAAVTKLEDAAARIIAAQPPEKQQALLAEVSNYLSQQKVADISGPEFAQQLGERITMLTQQRMQAGVNDTLWAARETARQEKQSLDALSK